MKNLIPVTVAVFSLMILPVPGASAQDLPDFSGTWVLSESTGGMAGMVRGSGGGPSVMMRGGLGQDITIVQEGQTLTIVRAGPQGEMSSVYHLDGSESRDTLSLGPNRVERVSTTHYCGR